MEPIPQETAQSVSSDSGDNLLATQAPVTDAKVPSFNDFKSSTRSTVEAPSKPVVPAEVPVVDQAKPLVDPVKLPDFQPFNQQPTKVEPGKVSPKKDFTGIAEEDVPFYRDLAERMSDRGFAQMKKLYLENKELTTKAQQPPPDPNALPSSYYSHPDAYRLSQEFQNLDRTSDIAQQLVDHWQEQYVRVTNNEPWINVTINKETGQLEYSKPNQFEEGEKSRLTAGIIKYIQSCTTQAMDIHRQRDAFVNNFKTKNTEAGKAVEAMKSDWFKGWEAKDHPTQSLQKQYMDKMPEVYKDNPLTPIVVMGRVLFDLARARIAELEKVGKVQAGTQQLQQTAQPKRDAFQAGSNGSPARPDFAAFKARKAA